jgi:hypothetical protein
MRHHADRCRILEMVHDASLVPPAAADATTAHAPYSLGSNANAGSRSSPKPPIANRAKTANRRSGRRAESAQRNSAIATHPIAPRPNAAPVGGPAGPTLLLLRNTCCIPKTMSEHGAGEAFESCNFLQIDRAEPAVTGCGICPDLGSTCR